MVLGVVGALVGGPVGLVAGANIGAAAALTGETEQPHLCTCMMGEHGHSILGVYMHIQQTFSADESYMYIPVAQNNCAGIAGLSDNLLEDLHVHDVIVLVYTVEPLYSGLQRLDSLQWPSRMERIVFRILTII